MEDVIMQLKKQPILSSLSILVSSVSITFLSGSSVAMTQVDNSPKWTGFYVGAGAGMGAWTADSNVTELGHAVTATQKQGGDGGFFTLTAGYDYLFSCPFLVGAFIDGDLGHLTGNSTIPGFVGNQSETGSWGLGIRFGGLINPTILPYLTAGASRAYFNRVNYNIAIPKEPFSGVTSPALTSDGYFLGAGLEAKLSSNWSLKGEYRYASYIRQSVALKFPLVPVGASLRFKPTIQTFEAVLVYKF